MKELQKLENKKNSRGSGMNAKNYCLKFCCGSKNLIVKVESIRTAEIAKQK